MAMLPRWMRLQVPKPRTFLGFLNLRIGVEMISLSMLFNKVTGFFGLLAIFTGFRLSPLQLSMYIYSGIALVLLAILAPHIRKQSPFHNLALAWLYLIDTIVNTAFTSAFTITWFLAVSADQSKSGIPSSAPGSGTIDDTAGFTSPKYNTSKVDVVATPGAGISGGQSAVAYAAAGKAAASAASPSLGHAAGIEESIPSLLVVVVLTLIRVYFILVMMAYARQVLRQYVYSSSSTKLHLHTDGAVDTPADNPFAESAPEGQGWKGKLGRIMVAVGKGYWLGGQADEAWVKGLDGRFKTTRMASGPGGTVERERRARSGTGPPKPSPNLGKL
ncbi:Inositol phoshorylceramide synthase regulatory subunit [Lachnellula hyalina]|uniref:Inositol phoshorylceramide synthase regulatory subunit n=1 Tax=Lachnellula hyalina TaxID=1316788 RepID=A0A8H8QXG4_9HELO|nr:Inositol phoshorylceramide synthase regulatory subunit [Lachnellula hyalina]TVY24548.1 Inositol phoshorylceramide synthase regulatory subunit [Lachnellula hyalina]